MENRMRLIGQMFWFIVAMVGLSFVTGKKRKPVEREKVSVSKAQYCTGCQYTVQAFANISATHFQQMQLAGEDAGGVAQAHDIANLMCDDVFFDRFHTFVRYSCMKVLNDYDNDFLLHFEGLASNMLANSKSVLYERTVSFCSEKIDACVNPVTTSKPRRWYLYICNVIMLFITFAFCEFGRNQCNACRVLAVDAESAYKTVIGKPKQVVEDVCKDLGYFHQPYVWLEEYCDEMMDDHSDTIVEILKFRDQLSKGGFTPDDSTADYMCSELYQCPKEKKPKQNIKDQDNENVLSL